MFLFLLLFIASADATDRSFPCSEDARELVDQGFQSEQHLEYDDALKSYNAAVHADSKCPEAYLRRGNVSFAMGRFEAALSDYDRSIELAPGLDLALFNRANALQILGRYPEALEQMNFNIQRHNSFMDLHYNRGNLYAVLGRNSDALDEYKTVLSHLDHFSPVHLGDVYYNRALIYLEMKQLDSARRDLVEALHVDSGHLPAQKYLKALTNYLNSNRDDLKQPKARWALVIGVGHFKDPKFDYPWAQHNAKSFANYILRDAHYDRDHVFPLSDEEATKDNILRALNKLATKVGPDDLLVLYISTHGENILTGDKHSACLLPFDAKMSDIPGSSISAESLLNRPGTTSPWPRLIMVMDACFSGNIQPVANVANAAQRRTFLDPDILQLNDGQVIMCSSGPTQVSYAFQGSSMSPFTAYLIEGLKNGGDIIESFEYSRQKVVSQVMDKLYRVQVPTWRSTCFSGRLTIPNPNQSRRH